MSYISRAMKVRRSTVLEIKAKGRSTLYAKKLLLRALRASQEHFNCLDLLTAFRVTWQSGAVAILGAKARREVAIF